MIENALFMRVREKHVLNGVQMEYGFMIASGIFRRISKWHSLDLGERSTSHGNCSEVPAICPLLTFVHVAWTIAYRGHANI
jgi:hypothetical protein